MMSDLSRMSVDEACRIIRLPKATGTPMWYKARVKAIEAIHQGYELYNPEEKRCEECRFKHKAEICELCRWNYIDMFCSREGSKNGK